MPTLLCVPIMVKDEDSALADAALAKSLGADLVEFRVDEFFSGTNSSDDPDHTAEREQLAVVRLVSASPLPCIATCRPTWEGGQYDGDEMARVSLYERLGTASRRDQCRQYSAVCSSNSRAVSLMPPASVSSGPSNRLTGACRVNQVLSIR